ncbi:tRNA (guanosine(37)-N1)-methyltransferase TrmD [Salinibius halmophilus]|uniref:tRNA (guanosine(37)-N1)-methyltransferase TrmD n=1 Tax=Salinibius halmophilus TaxID=1853216 RepID=UPI000E66C0E0|nr:tRNA (guanosine(37)-N1)-methyltransferase TrmD [Salinibius halmophilus]
MWIGVVTIFPEMLQALTDCGVSRRAVEQGKVVVDTINPRDFTHDVHKTVDDRPFGGGPGMLMKYEPVVAAINEAKRRAPGAAKVIYLSPQGKVFNQQAATALTSEENLIFLCGRYEGVDERIVEAHVDEEWSLGDFVLSGGELAAMTMMDAIIRLLPGVLNHDRSAVEDSFTNGLLDCPHYTRPVEIDGMSVPDVLRSGNHAAIENWRNQQALARTWLRRPELLKDVELDKKQRAFLKTLRESGPSEDSEEL